MIPSRDPHKYKYKIWLFWVSLFLAPILFFHLFSSSSIMIAPNIKRFWQYLLASHSSLLVLWRNLTDIDKLVKVVRCKRFHSQCCWGHSSWKNVFLHCRVFLRADTELAKKVQVFIYKANCINGWKKLLCWFKELGQSETCASVLWMFDIVLLFTNFSQSPAARQK